VPETARVDVAVTARRRMRCRRCIGCNARRRESLETLCRHRRCRPKILLPDQSNFVAPQVPGLPMCLMRKAPHGVVEPKPMLPLLPSDAVNCIGNIQKVALGGRGHVNGRTIETIADECIVAAGCERGASVMPRSVLRAPVLIFLPERKPNAVLAHLL